ncbi:flagellar basal body rod protein FlgC [Clostridia bacterium]|nr:flagellar basal body rod protein FlgC [Clostridia bacterium]
MNIFRSMDISGSALTAQRYRMDIIGENIANAETTRTADGGAYKRKNVVFQERPMAFTDYLKTASTNDILREHHYNAKDNPLYRSSRSVVSRSTGNPFGATTSNTASGGVNVIAQTESKQPMKIVYDPDHPDADAEGYVTYPNVDIEEEMVDMMSASRSYEANITALSNFKNIAMKALEIGR